MNRHTTPHPSASHAPARESHAPHVGALHKAAEEPPADAAGGFVAFLRALPLTTALTAAMGLTLLTVASIVVSMTPDPTAVARLAAYAALAVTALLGGIIAGRRIPDHPLLGALGAGVVFALLTALIAIPAGHLIPAPDTLGLPDSVPTAGQAVSVAQAACMRLGVAVLHPIAAYLTRPRKDDRDTPGHHTSGHASNSRRHTGHRSAGHSSSHR